MRGTTLGAYRITGSIGLGGMGAVYSAEHTLLGRAAAVKILLPELSRDEEIVTRFFNEARAAAAIRHPGIVEIFDFGWHTDGSAYLVMEHLRGESLAARLARGRIAVPAVMMIVRQIAGALAAAHKRGIVHRDLKPENIFVVPDEEVAGGERIKLLDFGIAKLVADNDQHRMTRPGALLGTPTYMAPEACRGEPVDHRADLYSLGCITFELCTGRPPFVDGGIGGVLASHVYTQPAAMSSLVPEVPPVLEDLVQRLLVKDLDQRIQSAESVVEAIDLATGSAYRSGGRPVVTVDAGRPERPLATTLSAAASGDAIRPLRARSRYRWFAGLGAAGALGALLAVVTIGALGHRRDRDAPPSVLATEVGAPRPTPVAVIHQPVAITAPIDADLRDATGPSSVVADAPGAIDRPALAAVVAPRSVGPRTTPGAPPDASPPPDDEPPTTAGGIVRLYVAVGQQLKVLEQDHGFEATAELWPSFTRIRIDDAIMDPANRDETAGVLRHLHDLIVERSR